MFLIMSISLALSTEIPCEVDPFSTFCPSSVVETVGTGGHLGALQAGDMMPSLDGIPQEGGYLLFVGARICSPCRDLGIHSLLSIAKKYPELPVYVIDMGQDETSTMDHAPKHASNVNFLRPSDSLRALVGGVRPATFVIDPDGRLVASAYGDATILRKHVKRLHHRG